MLSLSRLPGSMRAVADTHHLTTSTVSQQIAALAKETGAQLIEPEGRRVRLTPAGQRLADHAVTILAAVDSARLDLDPDAEPAGTVRVGGFATGIRLSLLPIVAELAEKFPKVHFVISEYEPIEAFALLTNDDLDLALTYDYNLAPASPSPVLETVALWSVPWGLGVPAETPDGPAEIADYADRTWIVNSRNTADEDAVRTLASLAGFVPRIAHEIDSLELVEDLILAGYGVGLLPIGGRPALVSRCSRWPNLRPYSPPTRSRAEAGLRGRRCARCWTGCGLRTGPSSPPEVAAPSPRAVSASDPGKRSRLGFVAVWLADSCPLTLPKLESRLETQSPRSGDEGNAHPGARHRRPATIRTAAPDRVPRGFV